MAKHRNFVHIAWQNIHIQATSVSFDLIRAMTYSNFPETKNDNHFIIQLLWMTYALMEINVNLSISSQCYFDTIVQICFAGNENKNSIITNNFSL